VAYTPDPRILSLAFSGSNYLIDNSEISFQVISAGTLHTPSGSISACDPLVQPEQPSFTQKVAEGDYEVKIAIARYENGDERIAFAMLCFSEDPPDQWKIALIEDQNEQALGDDEFFGYGVDAGIGCFMDAEAAELLSERMTQEDDFYEEITEGMQTTYKNTRSWLSFQPSNTSKANVVCFSSGWGDGVYPSFFGYSLNGDVVSLVTDFCLFPDSDPVNLSRAEKPWWKFWK
jgi:Protein of unknown function (DUF4241)